MCINTPNTTDKITITVWVCKLNLGGKGIWFWNRGSWAVWCLTGETSFFYYELGILLVFYFFRCCCSFYNSTVLVFFFFHFFFFLTNYICLRLVEGAFLWFYFRTSSTVFAPLLQGYWGEGANFDFIRFFRLREDPLPISIPTRSSAVLW